MAHYLISEAAHLADVEPHVLRYWEEELDLNIPRNELGHRYYTEQHIEMFKKIKIFKERGYQLKAIRSNLYGSRSDAHSAVGEDGGIMYISPGYENVHKVNDNSDEADRSGSCYGQAEGAGYCYEENSRVNNTCEVSNEALENVCEVVDGKGAGCRSAEVTSVESESSRNLRMQEFKSIMTDIVADAMSVNNEKMAGAVGREVGDRIIKEINYLAREQEEREEERFKRFDEVLRGYQRGQKAKAEAALAKEALRESRKEKRMRNKKRKSETIAVSTTV